MNNPKINNPIIICEVVHNINQKRFFYDKGDNVIVDKLINIENLNVDFTSLNYKNNGKFSLLKLLKH